MNVAADNQTRSRTQLAPLEPLLRTGKLLTFDRDANRTMQTALKAGMALSGAQYGVFAGRTEQGTASGLGPDDAFLGLPHADDVSLLLAFANSLGSILEPGTLLRSGEIARDSRFHNLFVDLRQEEFGNAGLPDTGRMRSCLVLPLCLRRDGNIVVAGILLFGHDAADAFPETAEALVQTLAAQLALVLEAGAQQQALREQLDEAKSAVARLGAMSNRLAHSLRAAQIGTWRWEASNGQIDFDGRGAELFGVEPFVPLSREGLRQHLVFREDIAFAPEDLLQVAKSGEQYRTEYRLAQPGGGQRWVAVRGDATFNPDHTVNGMIGTVEDISPRKMQEEALRNSEKLAATGRLAATIAHEINNPLEAVTNLIYLAKTDAETPTAVRRMLEIADGELARVSHIAQHTLAFYRDTSKPVAINLNELLEAVVHLFSRKLQGKRMQCTLDLDPGLAVIGLPGEIRQVVSNLLVNAIDASPAMGSVIRIRGRHRRRVAGNGVTMLICDQGEGIPHHVGRRLFTPFVTTKADTGTGLGLWVTRGMVEKHGGSVCFRSQTGAASGTVFRVYLPHSGAPAFSAQVASATIQ